LNEGANTNRHGGERKQKHHAESMNRSAVRAEGNYAGKRKIVEVAKPSGRK
jgi:hypothetical protein